MSFGYTKEAREHAKKRKLALFAVEIDGRTCGDEITGKYTMHGPVKVALARAMWFFCNALENGDTPTKAFAKFFKGGKPSATPKKKY